MEASRRFDEKIAASTADATIIATGLGLSVPAEIYAIRTFDGLSRDVGIAFS